MDLVTKNLLETFRAQQDLPSDIPQPDLFEHFANFCVASREYSDEFEVEDLRVAGARGLGRPAFMDSNDKVVGVKVILRQ